MIRKQDIVVTRTITCGQMAGYVCEAEWTKPGGIKVCSTDGFYTRKDYYGYDFFF